MNKALIFFIAAIVLGGAVAAYFVWQEIATSAREGTEFGSSHDQAECLDESLHRLSQCGGFICQARSLGFAHFCFPAAAPNAQLCEPVPRALLEAAFWPSQQCDGLDVPHAVCERIYRQVVKACLARKLIDPSKGIEPITGETSGPVLGRIPSINARVTEIKFYESGGEWVTRDKRQYQTRFEAGTTRYVNWEIAFEFPELKQPHRLEIQSIYYRPDGSVMGEVVRHVNLEAGWVYSWQGYGWGRSEPGQWEPGPYYVECYVEGERVAARGFFIR